MSSEPTSSLTFEDLIIEASRKVGLAYYGEDGDEEVQVPINPHDLSEFERHVNNAIRMLLSDAPKSGWRFARPVMSVAVWGDIAVAAASLITSGGYNATTKKTTLNRAADSFYESMEGKSIVLTAIDTFTVTDYVTAQQIKVSGDASAAGATGVTWSIASDANFTLPRTFGGEYTGDITYEADTNQGISLVWTGENVIRQWRENITDETGDPYWAAVRPMTTDWDSRRRWELCLYPKPDEVMAVEFPFTLHFDKMMDLDEVPPIPFSHDETIKAACLAIVDKDVENVLGSDWEYYRNVCLPNSYRIDAASAPRRLGYFGNPSTQSGGVIQHFRNRVYDRPTVTYA